MMSHYGAGHGTARTDGSATDHGIGCDYHSVTSHGGAGGGPAEPAAPRADETRESRPAF